MRFLFILCTCADALGPPQQVRAAIVNQTNINVTWSRPDGTDMVDTYTVRLYYTMYTCISKCTCNYLCYELLHVVG